MPFFVALMDAEIGCRYGATLLDWARGCWSRVDPEGSLLSFMPNAEPLIAPNSRIWNGVPAGYGSSDGVFVGSSSVCLRTMRWFMLAQIQR